MIISVIGFAIVALITYWWANSGAFSAFIHFLCVVTAGALAFAAWEPVSYLALGSGAAEYARGMVLLGVFIALLAVLRLFSDRFIPMNLSLPRSADVLAGGVFGLGSGLLSVGLLTIGIGFVQSTVQIGDYTGWSRRSDVPAAPAIGSDNAPILNVAAIASGFFGYLSSGAYTPWMGGGTLDTHMPQLVRTAGSLYRDSYSDGMGRVTIPPESVSGIKLFDVPPIPLSAAVGAAPVASWAVQFTVSQEGFDGAGQQFLLSASQARLVGDGKSGRAMVSFPVAWIQNTASGPRTYFFNSPSSYLTSVQAQGEGTFVLFFPRQDLGSQQPRYVELKGVRFPLANRLAAAPDFTQGGAATSSGAKLVKDPDANNINSLVDFPDPKYSIGSVVINSNSKGNLALDGGNFIIGGEQKFPRDTTAMVAPDLRVKGFQVATGQRLLRLDASAQDGGARIFPDLNPWVAEGGAAVQAMRVAVVDDSGAKYYAIGLVEDDGEQVLVRSMGGRPLILKDIPIQPRGAGKKLWLHFRVPASTKIRGLVLSDGREDRMVNAVDLEAPKDN